MSKNVVELKQIRYSVMDGNERKEILKGIDKTFKNFEITTISGPSGSGKTSLLYAIAGLLEDVEGQLYIGGTDLLQLPKKEKSQFRLNNISMIFQELNLFSFMNVRDNILLPYYIKDKIIDQKLEHSMRDLLSEMQLDGMENRMIDTLSGGERQRVAIIRAILDEPKIILCDEPTASLDRKNVDIFMQSLQRVQKKKGITCIIATHDPVVMEYGDTKVYMDDGKFR